MLNTSTKIYFSVDAKQLKFRQNFLALGVPGHKGGSLPARGESWSTVISTKHDRGDYFTRRPYCESL